MPHGGGHHGGGGGHFHGGGHHHHRHYGGVVYTGGGFYYRTRYRGCIWGGVGISLSIVIMLVVTLSVTLSRNEEKENRYTPGDTRIKTFDTFFCHGVKVFTFYQFTSEDASAYIITTPPPLTARNNFSIDDQFSLYEQDYSYWHFYLYRDSVINLKSCTSNGKGYNLYIIKGTSKWNDWKDYASDSKAVRYKYISTHCSESGVVSQVEEVDYKVETDDHYYIAYYNDDDQEAIVQQTLFLDRLEYRAPNSSSHTCSFAGPNSGSSCELNVPMLSKQNKVLVILPNVEDSKKEDTFRLNIDCIPRAEAYMIVILPPLIFLTLLVFCVVACCVYWRKMKKNTYRPLAGDTYPTTSQKETFNDPNVVPPPPPANPGFIDAPLPPPYQS